MTPQSVLVTQPSVSLQNLVGACAQVLNHSVSDAVDCSYRSLTDAEKFVSILDAMRNPDAPVGLPEDLLRHIQFSVLTLADSLDIGKMTEICSMPFVTAETKHRDLTVAVMSGTLDDWRVAVIAGTKKSVPMEIRAGFNNIHGLFVAAGLGAIWTGYNSKPMPDETFLLEKA